MADNEQLDGGSANKDQMKFLIMTIASMVIMFVVFAGVNYVIMENMITQKISAIQTNNEELGEDEDSDEIQKGIIVDLGDFILNLCDENAKRFLKVNVAIEVTKKDTDFPEQDAKGGGGHGHGEAAPADPMAAIQAEMNQFKPAIRDAVITNLSSKTSSELATAAGKELAKEQITNDINSILGGEREVLRVSFGQFIIQ
jgi:flagellar FliL protein